MIQSMHRSEFCLSVYAAFSSSFFHLNTYTAKHQGNEERQEFGSEGYLYSRVTCHVLADLAAMTYRPTSQAVGA